MPSNNIIVALTQTVERLISEQEQRRDSLMQEAEACDKRLQSLRVLLPTASDPILAEAIIQSCGMLYAAPPPPPPKPVQRVQVTREIIFEASQTFNESFTVRDLITKMLEGQHTAEEEFKRVHTSVAQMMMTMLERGWLLRVEPGVGRRHSLWRKIPMANHTGRPPWVASDGKVPATSCAK